MKIKQPPISNSPLLLFPFFILLFSFFSCKNPLIQKIVEPKTVAFESNGGSRVESQIVYKNQPVKRPPDPSKIDYNFVAWYTDNGTFLKEWDFAAIPNTDMTLYAKWKARVMLLITDAAITVTQPETGAVPNTTAAGAGNFEIGAVSWEPDHTPFLDGVAYTATLTLTAHQDYAFAPEPELTATINGNNAAVVNNTPGELTLSCEFPPTRMVTGITVSSQPTKLIYTHGEALDLSGLVATLAYNTGSPEDVQPAGFAGKGISAVPAHGTALVHSTHDGASVTVSKTDFTPQNAGTLTVNKKALAITGAEHTKQYDGSTSANGVAATVDGVVIGDDVQATVTAEYTSGDAGTTTINITGATLTGADAVNYTVTLPPSALTVAGITKADGAAVSVPVITGDAAALTVSVSAPAVLQDTTGQSIEYAIHDGSALSAYGSATTFTGLSTGKTYSVYARSAANTNYLAGQPSVSSSVAFYSVSFDANGGNGAPAEYTVPGGQTIVKPAADPTRVNFSFGGWYKEPACINEWVFDSDAVNADIILYAKWLSGQFFEVDVADITDPDFELNIESGIVVSRSGTNPNSKTAEISVNIPADWTVEWWYNGEILGSNAALTLNVSDDPSETGYTSPYNIVGAKHLLTVVIVTAEGAPYSRKIEFEVKQ